MNLKAQLEEFKERKGLANLEDIINYISAYHFDHKNPNIKVDQYSFLEEMCTLHLGLKMSQGKDYKIRFHISDLEKYNSLSPSKNKPLRKDCFVSEEEVFNLSVKLKSEKLIKDIDTNLRLAKYEDSKRLCQELKDMNDDLKLGFDKKIYSLSEYINKSYLDDNIKRMKRYNDKSDLNSFQDLLLKSESIIEEINDNKFVEKNKYLLENLCDKYLRISSKPLKIKRTLEYKQSLRDLTKLLKERCFEYYPKYLQECLSKFAQKYSSETLEKDISIVLKPYGLEYEEGKIKENYKKPSLIERIANKLKYALVSFRVQGISKKKN